MEYEAVQIPQPVVSENGCVRFMDSGGPARGSYACGSTMYSVSIYDNDNKFMYSIEYDLETLEQIPRHVDCVKDGIMSLKHREPGLELNIKFKVDPLLSSPILSKNKNAIILSQKHINNAENITTYDIYMYNLKGTLLHKITGTNMEYLAYHYFGTYSIVDDYQGIIYIWNHITNNLMYVNKNVDDYDNEIDFIGYDNNCDLFILYSESEDDGMFYLVCIDKSLKHSQRKIVYPHELFDKYSKSHSVLGCVRLPGYMYKLMLFVGIGVNAVYLIIFDPVKSEIVKEIEFDGTEYDLRYNAHVIGNKIIYNPGYNKTDIKKIFKVLDLINGTEKPINDYIPENQMFNISPRYIWPVGLNKCCLLCDEGEKIVDFNH